MQSPPVLSPILALIISCIPGVLVSSFQISSPSIPKSIRSSVSYLPGSAHISQPNRHIHNQHNRFHDLTISNKRHTVTTSSPTQLYIEIDGANDINSALALIDREQSKNQKSSIKPLNSGNTDKAWTKFLLTNTYDSPKINAAIITAPYNPVI